MKKEYNRIKKLGREIVGDKHYKKVKKLKNYEDKTESLKHLAASKLHTTLIDLESKIKEAEDKKIRLIDMKLSLLPAKIKIFKSTFNRRDYNVVKKLIDEIEEEINGTI
jgi:chaperonin GroEL (HSP60 family)